MHDAGHAVTDGGAAFGLDPEQLRPRVGETGKRPRRVRSPADAGGDEVRVGTAEQLAALDARLFADDLGVKLA